MSELGLWTYLWSDFASPNLPCFNFNSFMTLTCINRTSCAWSWTGIPAGALQLLMDITARGGKLAESRPPKGISCLSWFLNPVLLYSAAPAERSFCGHGLSTEPTGEQKRRDTGSTVSSHLFSKDLTQETGVGRHRWKGYIALTEDNMKTSSARILPWSCIFWGPALVRIHVVPLLGHTDWFPNKFSIFNLKGAETQHIHLSLKWIARLCSLFTPCTISAYSVLVSSASHLPQLIKLSQNKFQSSTSQTPQSKIT